MKPVVLILAPLTALALASCSGEQRPLRFATTSQLADNPRRAPGVAVDPALQLPKPVRRADSGQGLTVLKAPADVEQAKEVVKRFFRAVVREAPDEVDAVLSKHSAALSRSGESRSEARSAWRHRLQRLDYSALGGQTVYRERELEAYRASEIEQLPSARRPQVPLAVDDVLVRVPLAVNLLGKHRLFGDEIWFVLRPQPDGYQVIATVEDFRMP